MQCVTLLVGQVVTVIADDQFQLGAIRQLGRFVEVQSPVLHTRAQRGHVRHYTAVGWQADRESGYTRTPSNTAAYANKSLQELCRNCVRRAPKPQRPAWVDSGRAGAEFVRIPNEAFFRLLDAETAFREFGFASMSGRVFDLMRTLEELGSERVEQRVARHLLRHGNSLGVVRQTQSGIASDLGTAREVVFRALRALSQRRLLRRSRARIHILDRAGLAHVAGLEPMMSPTIRNSRPSTIARPTSR